MKETTEQIIFRKLDDQAKITNQILVNQGTMQAQTDNNAGDINDLKDDIKDLSKSWKAFLILAILQLLALAGGLVFFILNLLKDS